MCIRDRTCTEYLKTLKGFHPRVGTSSQLRELEKFVHFHSTFKCLISNKRYENFSHITSPLFIAQFCALLFVFLFIYLFIFFKAICILLLSDSRISFISFFSKTLLYSIIFYITYFSHIVSSFF